MTEDFFSAKAANVREGLWPNPKGKLREQFHEVARFKHLSQQPAFSFVYFVYFVVNSPA